ncbi:MAG TPA: ABC transporter substrate-binding protein [Dehalococcoidia bacterium]|nr:ABC transporter substrate-binding protein [Dehalococcoidia bacterium]
MTTERRRWAAGSGLRVSRRRFLALAAAGAGGAAAIAAARGTGVGGFGQILARGGGPRPGGVLRTGTTLPLSYGLDPHVEQGSGLAIVPRVFGYLLHADPAGGVARLDQASMLEQPDATTYVFRLREGVRFQDVPPVSGRAVEAADVVAAVERFRDHPLSLNKTWHTTVMSGIHADDPLTVRVTTLRPYVYTVDALGGISSGAIVPRELTVPGVDFNTSGAGSGPFRIAGVSSQRVRIERHEAYFGAPLPYLDAMEWRMLASDTEKLAAFSSGAVDTIAVRDRGQLEEMAGLAGRAVSARQPGLAYLSVGLRVDRPPFSDARVREAIDIALDRTALIRNLTLGEGEATGPVNRHLAGGYWSLPANEVVDGFRGLDDIDARRADARAMISAAGATDAVVRLQAPDVAALLDVAGAVGAQLATIGLRVETQAMDRVGWYADYHRGSFEATLISQPPWESPEMPTRLYHSAGTDGTGSAFGFRDAAIDALVERSWRETERETRRNTLVEAQRLMIKARPLIHLFTNSSYAVAWRYVRDWHPELVGSAAQYNYAQWLEPEQRAGAN